MQLILSCNIDSNDKKKVRMTSIELDMIQTAGIGALALLVGMVLTRKVALKTDTGKECQHKDIFQSTVERYLHMEPAIECQRNQ